MARALRDLPARAKIVRSIADYVMSMPRLVSKKGKLGCHVVQSSSFPTSLKAKPYKRNGREDDKSSLVYTKTTKLGTIVW